MSQAGMFFFSFVYVISFNSLDALKEVLRVPLFHMKQPQKDEVGPQTRKDQSRAHIQ